MTSHSQEFLILPAIDLLDGQSVRLQKGERASASSVAASAVAQLEGYQAAGARWVHVVNLNAAFGDSTESEGHRATQSVLDELLGGMRNLRVQLGGGLRDERSVRFWLDRGVTRIVIGTWAVKDPEAVARLARAFPGRIVVGLDSKDGHVTTHGWTQTTKETVAQFARSLAQQGIRFGLCTDVAQDGMLTGVDADRLGRIHTESDLCLIASGGVRDEDDIARLARTRGVTGVVIGKALAARTLRLEAALSYQRLAEEVAAAVGFQGE